MIEKEYKDLQFYNLFLFLCFIFFPAICFFYIIFGYVRTGFVVAEIILSGFVVFFFIFRTIFLLRYKKYNRSKKGFLFETISFISCFVFAISTAFLVKEDDGVFTYYFLNIYIQPAFMIFTFVVMGYMASTARRVAQIYTAEYQKRNPGQEIKFQKSNPYIGRDNYFDGKYWKDEKENIN